MKTLNAQRHIYSNTDAQIEVLERASIPSFHERITDAGYGQLKTTNTDILQVNLGKMCNQTCAHCHVDAGPDRKEIMTKATMQLCLDAIDKGNIRVADLTGGAPELNPHFRWFVAELTNRKVHVMVRCNLTIIVANAKFNDLPVFYATHNVEIISSLPHFSKIRTDAQRGEGVFDQSIKALKMLNVVGYGIEGSGLRLNLVFNPSGAFLPPSQSSLERDFKDRLKRHHNVTFNSLFAITNMPISRFLDYLIQTDNYDGYMEELSNAFNPGAVEGLMCRNTLSVGWDGYLYDCDFNQMLEMKNHCVEHIGEFNNSLLNNRIIKTGKHCYGCTAGAGSSCGGEIV
jgi:radical SAM/Cys-rich protein